MKRFLLLCAGLLFLSIATVHADGSIPNNLFSNHDNWSVAYNPNTKLVTIAGSIDQVVLYDPSGNVLLITDAKTIDMSIYIPGKYILIVKGRVKGEIALDTDN